MRVYNRKPRGRIKWFFALPVYFLFVAVSQRGLGLFLSEINALDYCGTVNKPQCVPFFFFCGVECKGWIVLEFFFPPTELPLHTAHGLLYFSKWKKIQRGPLRVWWGWPPPASLYIHLHIRSLDLQDLSHSSFTIAKHTRGPATVTYFIW